VKKHRLPLEGGAWRRTADGELVRDTAPDPASAEPDHTHETADRIADAKADSKPAPVATRGRGKHRED